MEKEMTYKKIVRSKECKNCNAFEDCLRDSKLKKWKVIKNLEGCCSTLKRY